MSFPQGPGNGNNPNPDNNRNNGNPFTNPFNRGNNGPMAKATTTRTGRYGSPLGYGVPYSWSWSC